MRTMRGAEPSPTTSILSAGRILVVVIEAPGLVRDAAPEGPLYREAPPEAGPATLTAVPYFLWANRSPGPMAVWLPEG